MSFEPHFLASHMGSVPHVEYAELNDRLARNLDIPAWLQLSRRTFRENMYVQFSAMLPRVLLDEEAEKITINTTGDITPDLEAFYERYLAEDVDAFGLSREYSAGFHALLDTLGEYPGAWVKGQVTGPISVGLTITDQDLRAVLYNDMLADAIVKNAAMNARWQIRQLRVLRPNVILFVDEPYMASFGSAYISLSREQVVTMLNEVFDAIHEEGALAGVHCCANTDWSVLLATSVDILNLDAHGYLENLALYPEELRAFLDRGGVIAWGIVPNNEEISNHTPEQLAQRLRGGLALISEKAQARGVNISPDDFVNRSLVMPSCGLGPTTVEVAERVFEALPRTAEILRQG